MVTTFIATYKGMKLHDEKRKKKKKINESTKKGRKRKHNK